MVLVSPADHAQHVKESKESARAWANSSPDSSWECHKNVMQGVADRGENVMQGVTNTQEQSCGTNKHLRKPSKQGEHDRDG